MTRLSGWFSSWKPIIFIKTSDKKDVPIKKLMRCAANTTHEEPAAGADLEKHKAGTLCQVVLGYITSVRPVMSRIATGDITVLVMQKRVGYSSSEHSDKMLMVVMRRFAMTRQIQ